jgi:hypothetical protein
VVSVTTLLLPSSRDRDEDRIRLIAGTLLKYGSLTGAEISELTTRQSTEVR